MEQGRKIACPDSSKAIGRSSGFGRYVWAERNCFAQYLNTVMHGNLTSCASPFFFHLLFSDSLASSGLSLMLSSGYLGQTPGICFPMGI